MANIKIKSVNEIESWNVKELRKLKITVKNRIQTLTYSSKPKTLPDSHPLNGMEVDGCKGLLQKVMKAEKALK